MSSRRGYLTQTELEEFADIEITDETEADDQISQAEEIIDAYVGPQDRFYPYELIGKCAAGSTTGFTLQTNQVSSPITDYYKGCHVEIIGGTGAGQTKKITASTNAGVITTETFSTALDTTSIYRIFQLGKFPRRADARYESEQTQTWYKWIPENVRRAVAAQVQYMISMGDKFFATDAASRTGESIGDYAYTKTASSAGANALIAPKAKQFLKGFVNRTGQILLDS